MATIKDVAKFANVSIGTVSNVLNGKTSNMALIEKVESAIKELKYRPDANARSLKNTQSNIIGLIIGNIIDPKIQVIISALEKELRSNSYSLIVKVSENNAVLEKKCIDYLMQQKVDGLIVYTSLKDKHFYDKLLCENFPIVFMDKPLSIKDNMNIIIIDYVEALDKCLEWSKTSQHKEVGVILEKGLIPKEDLVNIYKRYYSNTNNLMHATSSQESGFKAVYELLYNNPNIDMLILNSYAMTMGAKKAAELLNSNKKISFVCIKANNWIEDDNQLDGIINVSYSELGKCAASKLINAIHFPHIHEQSITKLTASFSKVSRIFYNGNIKLSSSSPSLNISLLDSPAARTLQMLAKVYEKEVGIILNFKLLDYHQLRDGLAKELKTKGNETDVFMMDLVWLEDFIGTGSVKNLDYLLKQKENYFDDIIEGLVDAYSVYESHLYGLPFMTGTQLLFYQKDLFEDTTLKMQFHRTYGVELTPPQTWVEFNLVAEFFTQTYNKNSPVKYGATLVNEGNLYAAIDFINRLYAYGGKIFSNHKVTISSEESLLSLKSYMKSYNYIDQSARCDSWEAVADLFKKGNIAMSLLYDSHAINLNNPTQSVISGNIGSSLIPGRCPVLGGWSLALNKYSGKLVAAEDFIMWACGRRISGAFSLLSGLSNRKSFYENKDLDSLYPWKSIVLESYKISKKRELPPLIKKENMHSVIYNDIIGGELSMLIQGLQNEETALSRMQQRLEDYLLHN